MRATVLLCDHAEVAEGKLFVNGGGWDLISPASGTASGLAVLVHVPWGLTNLQKTLHVGLQDQDGKPVLQGPPGGERPLEIDVQFEVGRPPGTQPGSEVGVPFALNFPPLVLRPNHAYVWMVEIDGQEVGRASFRTRGA